jgi:hypothetical protein
MSRVAQALKTKLLLLIAAILIVGGSIGIAAYIHNQTNGARTVTNAQHQLSQISYNGQNGVNAYVLLKKYATVQAKQYSFGIFVSAINGVVGDGPKYWTLYVNGKMSNVGASSYITKNSDKLTWELQ